MDNVIPSIPLIRALSIITQKNKAGLSDYNNFLYLSTKILKYKFILRMHEYKQALLEMLI